MKTFKLLNFFCALLICNVTFGQTNLILNPSFESGAAAVGGDLIDGTTNIVKATGWRQGFSMDYLYESNGTYSESQKIARYYSSINTPDLMDRYTTESGGDLRQSIVPNKSKFRNYYTGASPTSLNENFGGNRYGYIINRTVSDKLDGEVMSDTILSSLEEGCRYKIRFWAARSYIQNSANYNNAMIETFDPNILPRVEVVLRRRGSRDCRVILVTPGISSEGWNMYEGWFSLCADDIANGYNNIEFRNAIHPNYIFSKYQRYTGTFIDSVFLGKSGENYTPTSGYVFPDNITQNSNTTWSAKTVEIAKTYTLNSNLTISSNSVIKLMKDAKIVVQSGKTLTITDSELSGACGMWEGIVVESGGKIVFTNNKLFDAHIGIRIKGTSSEFLITNSTFDANYYHLYLDDTKTVGTSNAIYGNWLAHLKPLKDPCYTINGFGQLGVFAIECGNNVKIGSSIYAQNKFERGQYGAMCKNSNIEFINCYFTKINKSSIYAYERNKSSNFNLIEVNYCSIDYCNRGIDIENNTNLNVTGSTFEYITQYGISWQNNKKAELKLEVGQISGSNWNVFNRCTGTAIYCYNNSYLDPYYRLPTNKILIYYNKIYTSPLGEDLRKTGIGIYVSEPTPNTLDQFKILDITQNWVENIGTGIKVENVVGHSKALAETDIFGRPTLFTGRTPTSIPLNYEIIRKNYIYYYGWKPTAAGIRVSNSKGMHITHNRNFHTRPWEFQNKGIWMDNSQNSQVVYNYSKNGNGLLSNMNMMESNYFCDTFNTNLVGIQLLNNTLRKPFTPHGRGTPKSGSGSSTIFNENARDNVYQTKHPLGFDIDINNTKTWSVLWDFSTPQKNTIVIDKRKAIASSLLPLSGKDIRRTANQQEECNWSEAFVGVDDDPIDFSEIDITQSNPVLKFNQDYYLESGFVADSAVLIASVNANVAKLVQTEKWYFLNNSSRADSVISTLTPANTFERDYKNLLVMLIETMDTAFTSFDSSQLDTIKSIAQKRNYIGAAPVYVARAMYYNVTNILFGDDDDYQKTIRGVFPDSMFCYTDSTIEIEMALVDATNTIVNDGVNSLPTTFMGMHDRKVAFNPYILALFDTTKVVGFTQWQVGNYVVNSSPLKTIGEWLRQPEWDLALGQVQTTLLAEGELVPALPDDLVAEDGLGYDYVLETVTNNSKLKKKDGLLTLWNRTYNGYKNQTDLATALDIDDENNIFVLNQITINDIDGLELIQYNTDGDKIWSYTMYDTLSNIEPIGLQAIGYGGAEITCLKTVGIESTLQHYRIMRCQDIWNNHAHANLYKRNPIQEVKQKEKPICNIYPNPSHGEIFVKLEHIDEPCLIEIYTLQGQKVHEMKVQEGLNLLDMKDELHQGSIYIARILTQKGSYLTTERLVIK